jgi:hypothetical protein
MITLRPVAITDLNFPYARDMGDNKVRHYIVPVSLAVVKKFTGQDTKDIIKDYIEKTENEKDVVFDEALVPAFFDDTGETRIWNNGLSTTDVSKLILDQDKDIGRALSRVTSKNLIYQWNYYPTVFHKAYDHLVYFYNNKIVPSVNRLLCKLQGVDYGEFNHFAKQIGYANQIYRRKLDPVHFITIAFESKDAERALKEFRQDLRTLADKKLILGNLAMPSVIALADTVGLGRYYALFCFPIINHDRLLKVAGLKSHLDLPQKNQLSLVGVKHERQEGEVAWLDGKSPEDIYQIEKIYITDLDAPNRDKAVLDCYNNSVDHVNDISRTMKEGIKNTEKTESKTETIFNPTTGKSEVHVCVGLKKKDN